MIHQAFDRLSQRSELPARPVVVLVEHRDDVFDRLKCCFATAGFRVTRAWNSAQAIQSYLRESADLLVVNADQTLETAWLLAAKLQLTHPAARIWVYIHRPSRFDLAVANWLAIEELIELSPEAADLPTQVLNRLGLSADKPASCSSSSTPSDPTTTAAHVLSQS